MTDLLWPGDSRAGNLFSDAAFVAAMIEVESAWLSTLVSAGVAPPGVDEVDLQHYYTPAELHERIAVGSEAGGNPVMPLLVLLREGLEGSAPETARWLHRGLTSQDVVDSALMLCSQDAVTRLRTALRAQVTCLVDVVEAHRRTPMVARTLTQQAVPTTFGLKAAGWLTGVLDAYDDVATLVLPLQLGGAAGTLAAITELAPPQPHPAETAHGLTVELASRLGLAPSTPWHTARSTVTRLGDAAVRSTDAWGRIAGDVLVLSRPEIGELSEGVGGGSSTMPHKSNPVLATLIRRAALTTPQLASTLHVAAAETTDERSAGPWHAEWATLRTLLRRTVVAGEQTCDLLTGLEVHRDRMSRTLDAARDDVLAEQRSMAALTGRDLRSDYLGLTLPFIEAPLARAAAVLADPPPAPSRRSQESR